MSFGIVVWLLGQMIINVGMVLALLPVIGIPLPLISYGGSALRAVAGGPRPARGLRASRARGRGGAAPAQAVPFVGALRRTGAGPRSLTPHADTDMRVLLAGGGTAGHTSPLLATADALRRLDPDVEITCLGTARGLETRVVPEAGYPLELIPPVPLPRRPERRPAQGPGPAARRGPRHRRGARPDRRRRGRRLRRLRLDAGLPRRPPPQGADRPARAERRARPGQQGRRPHRPSGRGQLPRHPAAEGRVRRAAAAHDDRAARPRRDARRGPPRSSTSTPTGRPCS